jgi:hypothetical protein
MISYTLKRSKRKTVAIHVRDGHVEVRAPLKMAEKAIDDFVESKDRWIREKLAELNELAVRRKSFALTYSDNLTYRGTQYPITEKQGSRVGFDGERFYMPPDLNPAQIKYCAVQIYRYLAKRDLTEKTYEYAKRMSVMPAAVKINSAKTRWGSCSSKKSLNFSWMLIMADDDVIDYVVVHELAHMIELNHSARFWALVAGIFPDYKARKARLKDLQHRLTIEDWV